MAFLIYFFVLLVSAASVLFGLDLMSSPLPKTPNVPIGRSVQVASQPPVQEPQKKAADEQALTPVYPTTRGAPKVQAETSGAAPQQDAKLTPAPAEQAAPVVTPPAPTTAAATVAQNPAPAPAAAAPSAPAAPTQQAASVAQNSQPAVVTPTQQAKVEPPVPQQQAKLEPAAPTQSVQTEAKVGPVAATQPAQQANSCNVQACSASYRSFRASDCTYQPVEGDRRACSIGRGGASTARAAKPDKSEQTSRRSGTSDDLRDVERVVKRQPLDLAPRATTRSSSSRGEMTEVERIVRHMTREEAADIPVEDGDGRLFIVRKAYR